jgi:hypothetical protein
MARKIDYLSFIGLCSVIFSGNSNSYATLRSKSTQRLFSFDLDQFDPKQTFVRFDPAHIPLDSNSERTLVRLDPAHIPLDSNSERTLVRFDPAHIPLDSTAQCEHLFPGVSFQFNPSQVPIHVDPERTLINSEQIPLYVDPESGFVYWKFTIKASGRPRTFIAQPYSDGTIFYWRIMRDALPVFPQRISNDHLRNANDKLVKKILSCASNGDLKGLRTTLLRCGSSKRFIEQYPDLLFRVKKLFRAKKKSKSMSFFEDEDSFEGEDSFEEIRQEIIMILIRFGYHDADND